MLINDSIQKGIAITALEQVIDPEIGLNVIDLGLIYDIIFNNDNIEVIMTLTTPMCPMSNAMKENVCSTMQQYFSNYSINVKLVFEPAWSYDNISEKGREFLNS